MKSLPIFALAALLMTSSIAPAAAPADLGKQFQELSRRFITSRNPDNPEAIQKEVRQLLPAARKLAESGNATGQFIMVQIHQWGYGVVDRDIKKSNAWMHKAGANGHAITQGILGSYYEFAVSVEPDRDVALDWYRRSAMQGSAPSQMKTGMILSQDIAFPQKPVRIGETKHGVEALMWLTLSGKLGGFPIQSRKKEIRAVLTPAKIVEAEKRAAAFKPVKEKPPAPKKPKRKPNPIFAPVKDDPKLPRVLLIGDSISIGYTLPTREFLKGKANLHRIPTNGGPTTRGLANIDKWLGKGKWDVIHFNWGLHDLKYMGPKGQNLFPKDKGGKLQVPIAAYEKNLETLVVRLKKTGAKLIWRNTTPVPPGAKGRHVGDSIKYNAAAARVMKKHSIPTHDLFTMSKARMKELMLPVNVHYKKEGSRVLGRDVARVIEAALKK